MNLFDIQAGAGRDAGTCFFARERVPGSFWVKGFARDCVLGSFWLEVFARERVLGSFWLEVFA